MAREGAASARNNMDEARDGKASGAVENFAEFDSRGGQYTTAEFSRRGLIWGAAGASLAKASPRDRLREYSPGRLPALIRGRIFRAAQQEGKEAANRSQF